MSDLKPRPPKMRLFVYVPVVVLLYIGDLIAGIVALFYGLGHSTPVFFVSLANWGAAWVLCYFGYKRSRVFGYVLLALTGVITVFAVLGALLELIAIGSANGSF